MRFPIPNMENLNGQVDFYRNIFCARHSLHSFRLFSAACGTFISSELLRFFRNDPTGRISHHVYIIMYVTWMGIAQFCRQIPKIGC